MMFESVASEIGAALNAARDVATEDQWGRIRQRCRDVTVLLESCGQVALAARIQREYERLKHAWQSADPRNGVNGQVTDAGHELCATLVSLAALQLDANVRGKKGLQSGIPTGGEALSSPTFTHSPWPGSDCWENWGIGLASDGSWHLFHFLRQNGGWRRHRHATLVIPTGIAHALASKLIRFGFLTMKDAHAILLEHASGGVSSKLHEDEVVAKIKSPMSRLRAAIREAAEQEGHRPKGMPITAPTKRPKTWRARARFGKVEKREGSGYQFQIPY
jgi:hypothetical protein